MCRVIPGYAFNSSDWQGGGIAIGNGGLPIWTNRGALVRTRKGLGGTAPITQLIRGLQWGRVSTNAEGLHSDGQANCPLDASMERSYERGKWRDQEEVPAQQDASMGPRSHERGREMARAIVKSIEMLLQWGRARESAEGHAGRAAPQRRCRATTEPRSNERGKRRKSSSSQSRSSCFNGAAFL